MISLHLVSHGTYLKYNDWWIIGRSYDEIVKRYGEFDRDYGMEKGYYIGDDDGPIMPSHMPYYYWIVFDGESGNAAEVYVNTLPGGINKVFVGLPQMPEGLTSGICGSLFCASAQS